MRTIAIDLGGGKSQFCIRQRDGQIEQQGPIDTGRLGSWLQSQPPAHVVFETSSEAFALAEEAGRADHRVSVVPSILVRELGVGRRGIKTDERDAQALSEAACRIELPSVHVPSEQMRHWRSANASRAALVQMRTKVVNTIRGYLRTQLHRPVRHGPTTLSKHLRKALGNRPEGLPAHIDRLLVTLELLNEQIRAADEELAQLVHSHAAATLLMTIPGVGPVTATRFVAAIDDPSRFANATAVSSYLGLTAGERSSGRSKRRTGITKAGPASVRAALGQAAWCLWRLRPDDPMVRWARKIAERSGRQIAIMALSRKLARTMWAMWRDGRPYQPQLGAEEAKTAA